jgi:hypothetical protein
MNIHSSEYLFINCTGAGIGVKKKSKEERLFPDPQSPHTGMSVGLACRCRVKQLRAHFRSPKSMKLMLAALVIALIRLAAAQLPPPNPNDLVRRVINNELKLESQDHSHWMFQLDSEKQGKGREIDEVVETRDGDLTRPLVTNGRQVAADQADRRVQEQVHNSETLRKSLKDKDEDTARSQMLLKMLPDAFIFTYAGRRGDLINLNFSPNPNFKPSGHEAEVFHAMKGNLWLNSKQLRLKEIAGHLVHEVKFGGGVLGHLDPGGDFDVKQAEVAAGFWELTVLNVNMKGKALFFKTIAVQQKYSRANFKQVRDDLTPAGAAEILHKRSITARDQSPKK